MVLIMWQIQVTHCDAWALGRPIRENKIVKNWKSAIAEFKYLGKNQLAIAIRYFKDNTKSTLDNTHKAAFG